MERGRRKGTAAAVLALGLGLPVLTGTAGCVEINGGAVEVFWSIFTKDGRAITDCSCAEAAGATGEAGVPLAYVRLNLVSYPDPGSEPCAGQASCRFSCNRKVGATPFMIPPGQYLMSLVAVSADFVDLPSVGSPAPQSRPVVRGQPTELEAFMLEATCATRCNSAGMTQPCTGG